MNRAFQDTALLEEEFCQHALLSSESLPIHVLAYLLIQILKWKFLHYWLPMFCVNLNFNLFESCTKGYTTFEYIFTQSPTLWNSAIHVHFWVYFTRSPTLWNSEMHVHFWVYFTRSPDLWNSAIHVKWYCLNSDIEMLLSYFKLSNLKFFSYDIIKGSFFQNAIKSRI